MHVTIQNANYSMSVVADVPKAGVLVVKTPQNKTWKSNDGESRKKTHLISSFHFRDDVQFIVNISESNSALALTLSTRIVPLRFQAGGRRRRPNLGYFVFYLCYLYSLVKMHCGVLFYLV